MNPTSLRRIRSLCSAAFLALSACTTAEILQMELQQHQPPLLAKVGYDTGCPQYDIKVLSWGPDYRAAQVNACGRVRRYQDISGYKQTPNWIDATTFSEGGAPVPEAPPPVPPPPAAPPAPPPST
jgi:hypothetical protein